MSFTHQNHYVSVWYQKGFLYDTIKEQKFYYLDLSPTIIAHPDGRAFSKSALRRLGPKNCFYETDLYTTKFASWESDEIERKFFGPIDVNGHKAIEYFCDFKLCDGVHKAWEDLMLYMDAQVFRTPRGLDRLATERDMESQRGRLFTMQALSHVHITMWSECIWEIWDCSAGDLIISDNPVTFFNRNLFPGARECRYPLEPSLGWLGTQTLFPLRRDRLLVLTHLQWARDPSYNPKKSRVNTRAFSTAMFNLEDIISHRSLTLDQIHAINYIIKTRACRYVAAVNKDDLFPEKFLKTTHWSKLGGEDFLIPDPRDLVFSTGTLVGYADGSSWGADEYGRPYSDNRKKDKNYQREWDACQRRKVEWDKKYGLSSRRPPRFKKLFNDN